MALGSVSQKSVSPQAVFSKLTKFVSESVHADPLDFLTGVTFKGFSIEDGVITAQFTKRVFSIKVPPVTMLAVRRLFESEGYEFDGDTLGFRFGQFGDLKKRVLLTYTFDFGAGTINADVNVTLEAQCPKLAGLKMPERVSEFRSLMGFTSPKPIVYGQVLHQVHDLLHVVKFHEPFRSATIIRAWKVLGVFDLTVRGLIGEYRACPHEIDQIVSALQKSIYYYGSHFTIDNESVYKVYKLSPYAKEERFVEVHPDRWDGRIKVIAEFSFHAKCE